MPTSPHIPAAPSATIMQRLERSPALVLAAAVVGISFAAPLVRLSNAPALAIATWRLGFSMVIIALILATTGGWRAWRTMPREHVVLSFGAGALLALHFWSWNVSLRYTTVAASVSLVSMQPIIIAVISARWLHERATAAQWVAIVVAVVGAIVIGWADVPRGASAADQSRALLGDALALLGALTGALYYLIGRRVRPTLPLWPYVGLVYGAAFLVCAGL
ncbi:MAG: DMT family transporter, partial [Gemmatimonadaceae bacterium]|nr:DMT family transporter [Gemmatimonadaceae bacterium]